MQQLSLAESSGRIWVRSASAILLIATAVSMGLSTILIQPASASLNSWSSATKYPIGTWNQSCVVYSGFVYCIGGRPDGGATSPTNAVYFAQLLPGGGLGSWSSTTNNYPTSIDNQSCVVDSGFVYCIGGFPIISAVYFAPLLTTGGVGTWMPTTSYPTKISQPSCVVYSGFVYCITGFTGSEPLTNAVHFAQLLPGGGLGSWSSTTNNYPLPILGQSCVVNSGFAYCFGGYNFGIGCVSQCGPPDYKTAVYFAQLSSSGGVGSWSATTNYPINISGQSCIVVSGFVYCIGGFNQVAVAKNVVYFAPLSSSGVGFWTETTDLPNPPPPIGPGVCVADSGFVYCIGGCCQGGASELSLNTVYFASITPNTAADSTSTSVTCSPSSIAVGQSTHCTATVTDTSASSTPPGGNLTFSTCCSNFGLFTPSGSPFPGLCTLGSTSSSTSSCSVSYASCTVSVCGVSSPPVGQQCITASYTDDPTHQASAGSACVQVSGVTTALFTSTGVSIPIGGPVPTLTSVYDTAIENGVVSGKTPSGTVSYTFFTNSACSDSGISAGTVTLTSTGAVPNSNTEGPLAAGSYSFNATYSGDSNYPLSTSACEPFSVVKTVSNTGTVVSSGGTIGASAFDTATVTTSRTIVGTGTVTYTFWTNGGCSGSGTLAGSVTLASTGAVPNSNTEGPLAAGSYSFSATYSGDSNYAGSSSPCERFSVGLSNTATTVFDASTKMAWSGTEQAGASAYDTVSVTTSGTIVATGTISYTFFNNGVCSGIGTSAGTVTLTSTGAVPNSNTEGPLAAGSYSFSATYSGDSNYSTSTSSCESFTVTGGTVGGTVIPVDKLALLAPYFGMVSLIVGGVSVTFISVRRIKNRKKSRRLSEP